MASGNLPALKNKTLTIYIQTDSKHHRIIEESEITKKMKIIGVCFDYVIIPDDVIKDAGKDPYWLLGATASLGFQYTKKAEAAFHMSYPDMVYSNKYFSELLRLAESHKAILAPGMRSDESLIEKALAPYISDNIYNVPCADLVAIHLNCLHKCSWPLLVNNRPRDWTFPNFHVMLWEGEDYLRIDSPHTDPIWFDKSIIAKLEPRYFMTIDSEMDLIIKGDDYYIPNVNDEIYRAEISNQNRDKLNDSYATIEECALTMWQSIAKRDCFKFFVRGMKLTINREIRPKPDNAFPTEAIKGLRNTLINVILSQDVYRYALKRTHDDYLLI